MRRFFSSACVVFGLISSIGMVQAASSGVPEPFQGFDADSKYTIKYDDLSAVLRTVVVDVGRSTREKAAPTQAKTGTRMKVSVKRSTINEANRFYFETFEDHEDARQYMLNIQKSLEQIPEEAPLKYFSRDEQLAYWLNLYNVTVMNELIKVYPKRNLKKVLTGKKSIFNRKLLTVAGIPLSLNDIQFTILRQNYGNDPLIIYGLYQGNIGGPNIRRRAYSGADVYRALKNNAMEFINSNRGTYAKDEKTFRVSSLYDRNRAFFPNFNADLSKHLLVFLEEPERGELQRASKLKADINDWTVTDLGGTNRNLGGAFADNNAALLDSVKGTTPADGGGTLGAAVGYGSSTLASKGKPMSRFDPELLTQLQELNVKRKRTNVENATVTMEELGEVGAEETKPDPDSKKEDNN
ncbi:MAG: DUF547 domain-containing protein [Xanthomonadales bacterium]|nr:DUF547 domain-containing protein [Gammaproteobacteria bacterium]NNK05102.1 DUF547 domain-containing protein [Xanthomonadales bacterium]